jgi:hypothetical protein
MMAVSIPMIDWFDIRDQIDRLNDDVNRLEKTVEALVEMYQKERVKLWEIILIKMIERKDRKAKENRNEYATGKR